MLRKSISFLWAAGFLARSSIIELAIGLVILSALQKLLSDIILGVVHPVMISVFGAPSFQDYFIRLSSAISASNLADAQKQGPVLAYGEVLTTLINLLILVGAAMAILWLLSKLRPMEPQHSDTQKKQSE